VAARGGVRRYWAVVKALQRSQALTSSAARAAWRGLKERLGRTPNAADVRGHPRMAAEAAKRGRAVEAAARRDRERVAGVARKVARELEVEEGPDYVDVEEPLYAAGGKSYKRKAA
jgi:hypothetical protein